MQLQKASQQHYQLPRTRKHNPQTTDGNPVLTFSFPSPAAKAETRNSVKSKVKGVLKVNGPASLSEPGQFWGKTPVFPGEYQILISAGKAGGARAGRKDHSLQSRAMMLGCRIQPSKERKCITLRGITQVTRHAGCSGGFCIGRDKSDLIEKV